MKHKYLLTICIPTYNRSKQLANLLDSIIRQIDPRVEVVISDNASTDSTLEILINYSEKYPYIRFQSSNKNNGFIGNYSTVAKSASGKYLWFVGSDDEISPRGISTVLDFLLIKPDIDGLLVNFRLCDKSLNDIEESFWAKLNQPTEILTNSREAFAKYWHYSGFFSAAILRRDLWNEAMLVLPWKEYPYFLHMLVTGHVLLNSSAWGFINNACIRYRSGDSDTLHAFGGKYLRIVVEVDEVQKALRYLTKGEADLMFKSEKIPVKLHLLSLVLSNLEFGMPVLDRMNLVKKLSVYYWRHLYFWVFIFPILVMPIKLTDILRKIRKNLINQFR